MNEKSVKLFNENIRLVQYIADRIIKKFPQYATYREDWFQDAYIKSIEAFDTYNPKLFTKSAYLNSVLYRRFVRFMAKNAHVISIPENQYPTLVYHLEDYDVPELLFENFDDFFELIFEILGNNKRNYAIFCDRFYEGLEYGEIGKKYGIARQRACEICMRALRKLKKSTSIKDFKNDRQY
jgi:RNA polymerase sigma factor (sigma-70 family)